MIDAEIGMTEEEEDPGMMIGKTKNIRTNTSIIKYLIIEFHK